MNKYISRHVGPKINKNVGAQMVVNSINALIKIENFYGIFRFHAVNGDLKTSTITMKIYSMVMICIFVIPYCLLLRDIVMSIDITGTDKVVKIMDEIPVVVMVIQHIIFMVYFFSMSEKNIIFIKAIARIDSYLNLSRNKDFFNGCRTHLLVALVIFIITYAITCIFDFIKDDSMIFYNLITTFIDFERHLEAFAFYAFIKMIIDRIDIINKYLANISQLKRHLNNCNKKPYTIKKEDFIFIGTISNKNTKIITLAAAYDVIGEAFSLINQIFNLQIFLTMVSTFTYIIITIWVSIYPSNTMKVSKSLLSIFLQCAAELLSLGLMSYICEVMHLKRNLTEILLNKVMMDYEMPQTMRRQAKSFMELIKAWPLEILTFEMLTLNIKLLIKFISVVSTYLIVITQISHFL